ncbi:MAG: TRAP transporter small permease [Sedimentibacter sp.]
MKVIKWLDNNLEETLMGISLWLIVFIMGLQVIMRYVFKSSISWSEETCRYLFIWLTFLGISYAVHNNSHIRLDIIETLIPRTKKALEYIGDLVFLGFCVYMLKPAFKAVSFLKTSNQLSPALQFPMYLVYSALMVGLLLTICRIVQKYVNKFKNKGIKEVEQ